MVASIATLLYRYGRLVKWLSIALIVVSLAALTHALPIAQAFQEGAEWIEQLGIWGPVVYGVLYVVATVLFVPGSIPTLAGGAIFGLWVGFLTVWLGSTAGAMAAFLVSRYVARDKVARLAAKRPKFDAIDRAVGEGGWRIVAMLRLSPAIPFNLQNYLYGLTQIRFWPCLMATWLAMVPGTFMLVYIGHVAGAAVAGERERTIWEWVMLGVGLVASISVTVYITLLAKRKLSEQTELEEAEPGSTQEEPPAPLPDAGPAKRPSGALLAAAIALLAAATAVYAQLNTQAIEDLLPRVFGPPQIEMREAYEEDPG